MSTTSNIGSPADIDWMPTSYTRDANGNVLTVSKTDGINTWVQTVTRDANGNVLTVSAWVRQ
ncbi:hypothetical protein [Ancylobacter amanitiformis]|uniref:YD repeat-containing protein n=1 Tax=Ancylobacter amanitiformis TaxID=217069 RepID=A0ABU0LQ93_9HYPH|nr:hypothetical protein [Ancylobacter amanitiformis]MDQ0510867.1 YD repeat-containing protein [Ancylobacter amanitiformis]